MILNVRYMERIVVKMWNERKYILQQHFKDNVPEDVDDSKYRQIWTDMIDMVTDEVIECVVNQSTMGPCLQRIEFSTSPSVEFKYRSDESGYELERFFFDENLSIWVLQVRFHPCEYGLLTIDGFMEKDEAVKVLMNLALRIIMGIRKVGERVPYTRSVLHSKDKSYELEYLYELSSWQNFPEPQSINLPRYLRDLGWKTILPILKGIPKNTLKELKKLYEAPNMLYGSTFDKLTEKFVEDSVKLQEFRWKLNDDINAHLLQLLHSALGDGYLAIVTFLLEIKDETSKYLSYPDCRIFYGKTLDELFARIQDD